MKRLKVITALFILLTTPAAFAGIIIFDGTQTTDGVNASVQYFEFTADGGAASIQTSPANVENGAFDPVGFLFEDSLAGTAISNDFLFGNPWNLNLTGGFYVLAISNFQFSQAEAISGINPDTTNFGSVSYTVTIEGNNVAAASVPEPGTLVLLGAGLLGIALKRRRIAA